MGNLNILASSGVVLIGLIGQRVEPSNPVSLISEGWDRRSVVSNWLLRLRIGLSRFDEGHVFDPIAHHLPSVYAGLKIGIVSSAGFQFVCERHILKVIIEEIPGQDFVRVTSACEGPSRTFQILPCGYQVVSRSRNGIGRRNRLFMNANNAPDNKTKVQQSVIGPNLTISAETEVMLKPNKAQSLSNSEIKRLQQCWYNYLVDLQACN